MSNSGAHLESKIDFQQIVGQNPGKPAADLRWRSEGAIAPPEGGNSRRRTSCL